MEFKTFPELTDILLREQCETSGGYWHKHKLERGRVFSENPSHEQSILPDWLTGSTIASVFAISEETEEQLAGTSR